MHSPTTLCVVLPFRIPSFKIQQNVLKLDLTPTQRTLSRLKPTLQNKETRIRSKNPAKRKSLSLRQMTASYSATRCQIQKQIPYSQYC